MSDNSQQILDDVLTQQKQELAPEVSDQDFFEVFCADQILKDFDLSYEEIQSGIVDGEHDGGVDAIYSLVNGELVTDDFDVAPFKRDVRIELFLIQSKTSGGFSEIPINRLISTTRHLLNLTADYSKLTQYNSAVKTAADNFRTAYRGLAARFPRLKVRYFYASKKADVQVHANLELKAAELAGVARELFADAEVTFEFLGARRLLELARRRPKTSYELKVNKSLTAANGYVVLSSLSDYDKFLRANGGRVQAELFESNVRDFQGDTEVNAEIGNTLRNENVVDFWWMNNGVTILASRATLNGDVVTVESPQIVNGLQTSTQIARHFGTGPSDDKRQVMVKIVASEDEETRDKIIKATNSQNAIQPATLRATDKVQRDIEQTLKKAGLFYDRRKNFYKNEGKPADKIISIPLMAQAVMSLTLARPDTARARPSSLIKEDAVYSSVFAESYPISLYIVAGSLIRTVDRILRGRSELTPADRSNLRFYALFFLGCILAGNPAPKPSDIAAIDTKAVTDSDVEMAADEVYNLYLHLGATDQVAKGPELTRKVQARVREVLGLPAL